MFLYAKVKIRSFEKGLLFKDGEFVRLLHAGVHRFVDPFNKLNVRKVSLRAVFLEHEQLDVIVKSGALEGLADVLELDDHQRALVWIDGRFARILDSGLHALWTGYRKVKIQIVDTAKLRFEHAELDAIVRSGGTESVANTHVLLNIFRIEEGQQGVGFINGEFAEVLGAGLYASWNRAGKYKVYTVDTREKVIDIAGQEIMTEDKVTLRMNAVLNYRIVDARKSVEQVQDAEAALYRETQLALRAEVGTRKLDALLSDKEAVARALEGTLTRRANEFGARIEGLGIRDIILPGDMKTLLNRVMEARKEAEANVIQRREETAAMRSQVNTAKLLENNPVLMRMKELEVLEKVTGNTNLSVVLGEQGLTDRIMKLL